MGNAEAPQVLTALSIRDFAIIDDLQLTLGAGMTVLSGETGAGKSILIDALGLLLGDRADAEAVREGAERAEVAASFSLGDAEAARAWLVERDLDAEDDCLLRRVVAREGRSRMWINGSPVNARDLRELGEHLVDIHGQHAHQSLLRPAAQRDALDAYAGNAQSLAQLAATVNAVRGCEDAITKLAGADADGGAKADLLRYQVEELRALNLGAGELAALDAEHRRLANAERLLRDGGNALTLLTAAEDSAALDALAQAERLLQELTQLDPSFTEAADLAAGARIQAQEAADGLVRVLDALEMDPQRLQAVEARLAAIHDLARKHRCAPAELVERGEALAQELAALENAGERLAALEQERQRLRAAYAAQAAGVSTARAQAAEALAAQVTAGLRELGMPDASFAIQVRFDAEAKPARHGSDAIAFRLSANPGQAPRALERVASGGELSRVGLAIQAAALHGSGIPTLVFDEVDAGIGGGVAEIVGRLLKRLGARGQSLCVTHLPQVAAQAHQHLVVSKQTSQGRSRTAVRALSADERVEELARMLGGLDITAATRHHAREMIERAAC